MTNPANQHSRVVSDEQSATEEGARGKALGVSRCALRCARGAHRGYVSRIWHRKGWVPPSGIPSPESLVQSREAVLIDSSEEPGRYAVSFARLN